MSSAPIGTIHHVELWVPDIDRAAAQWGWLLTELGYQPFQEWTGGCSWRLADTYIVIEQSPDMLAEPHDRKRPGLKGLLKVRLTPDLWGREVPAGRMSTCPLRIRRSSGGR